MARACNFLDEAGAMFGFCQERISGKGEDSCCYRLCERGGILAVFDGCGGSGAETYPRLGNHSGAYLASRAASAATMEWLDLQLERGEWGASLDIDSLRDLVVGKLSACEHYSEQPRGKIRGSIMRSLPTTMAAMAMHQAGDQMFLTTISAGDSHLYMLDAQGLSQLNHDDVDGGDAFTNLYDDPPMTNVIALGDDFELRSKVFALRGQCVLIAATDGCFAYMKSPMEFELLLLDTLRESRSVDEWEKRLAAKIDAIAGDDQTLLALVYGFRSFGELRNSMRTRHGQLAELLSGIDGEADAFGARSRIWEAYREGYYAALGDDGVSS